MGHIAPYEVVEFTDREYTAGINVTSLSPNLLRNNISITGLSDALQSTRGIYTRNYGNGMLSGISLRGFGSDRTNIIWNGISINNAGLGSIDLNLIQGSFFNSIQLIEGGSSTQYGSGSQGGSLVLGYIPEYKSRFDISIGQGFGSFFTWNTALQSNYGNGQIQGRTAFIRNSSTNDYAYKDKTTVGFPTRLTVNSDFFSYQAMQDVFVKFRRSWHLSIHGWYNYTDRKIPPAMGAANNESHQWDENIRVMADIKKYFRKHVLQIQAAYIRDKLVYSTTAFMDSSLIHNMQLQAKYKWKHSSKFSLTGGGNFTVFYSEYKYYVDPVTELRGNVFVLAHYQPKNHLSFTGGIRQQFSSNFISLPSGHLGMDHVVLDNSNHTVMYKLAVATAYRMPTLNDLYWVPGGNTDLKAEYSWNVEHTWKYLFRKNSLRFEAQATGYFGRTDNWIQWSPTPFGYWVPENINLVQSAGLEASSQLRFVKRRWQFIIGASYSFTHATNLSGTSTNTQLIYVPMHSIKGNIELKWKEIYLTILPSFYSKRYTLGDNTQFIPPFFLLNLQAGYKLKLRPCSISFFGRLGNTTHADYQMILNRPMPGINFTVGINFYLNTQTLK